MGQEEQEVKNKSGKASKLLNPGIASFERRTSRERVGRGGGRGGSAA